MTSLNRSLGVGVLIWTFKLAAAARREVSQFPSFQDLSSNAMTYLIIAYLFIHVSIYRRIRFRPESQETLWVLLSGINMDSFLFQRCDKDAENLFDAAQNTSNGIYIGAAICAYFIISGIVGHFVCCCKTIGSAWSASSITRKSGIVWSMWNKNSHDVSCVRKWEYLLFRSPLCFQLKLLMEGSPQHGGLRDLSTFSVKPHSSIWLPLPWGKNT